MEIPADAGIALLFTVFAGLSTGIGSAVAYFIRKPQRIYLSFSLGFSAGVMIYISFMELLPRSLENIGETWVLTTFFGGIAVIGLIDLLVPETQNPHHYRDPVDAEKNAVEPQLMRTGLLTALAIGIHNFPEGLATFGTTLSDVRLGGLIALAIAIHNIPEGISVSVPIFYATGNRKQAFIYSFLSGIAEPVGAILGFLVLLPFLSDVVLTSLLAFVAGIMVYISLDELLPLAHRYGYNHTVILGLVFGMLIMAISLVMF